MRRIILVIGIILLFLGVVIFSMANQFNDEEKNEIIEESIVYNSPRGEWHNSWHFDIGDRFWVGFTWPNMEGISNGGALILVNITDPNGGLTRYEMYFRNPRAPELNITILERSEGLDAGDPPGDYMSSASEVGGVAKLSGNYTADVYTYRAFYVQYYPDEGVLPRLEFVEVITEREYPSAHLLPHGVVLLAAGIVVSVYGARSGSKPTRRNKRASS